jgi:hypothetical protein
MRRKVSLQEIPASTRMLASLLERTVQFPRLPLARTVMRNAIVLQHNGIASSSVVSKWLTGPVNLLKTRVTVL